MDRGPAINPMTEPHGICRDVDLKDRLTFLRASQHLRYEIERRPLGGKTMASSL
jgi:hypothetical protein